MAKRLCNPNCPRGEQQPREKESKTEVEGRGGVNVLSVIFAMNFCSFSEHEVGSAGSHLRSSVSSTNFLSESRSRPPEYVSPFGSVSPEKYLMVG
jgi:hypothetical protein